MVVRTTQTTVTFQHAFTLTSLDGPQPAGSYRLVMDEQEIPGLSFLAFQRTATMLYTPAVAIADRPDQVFLINPAELAAALEEDGRAGSAPP